MPSRNAVRKRLSLRAAGRRRGNLLVVDIRPDGMVHAPDRPGLGFTLREDALERFGYVDGPEYKFHPIRGRTGETPTAFLIEFHIAIFTIKGRALHGREPPKRQDVRDR